MPTLLLLRHGQSTWNLANRFTGWVDVDLTDKGEVEAVRGGELIGQSGALPDVVHTSVQRRAIRSADLALEVCDRLWIPVRRSWRLNERHYGALQGKDKKETLAQYGEEQFMRWRRSYDVPPPPLDDAARAQERADPRYAAIPSEAHPASECLADVVARMLPYWYDGIVPDLQDGRTVLVVAHGNSLRAMVKHLDRMSDADVVALNIPTGIPLRYTLDDDMQAVDKAYLDPQAAQREAAVVAQQGR